MTDPDLTASPGPVADSGEIPAPLTGDELTAALEGLVFPAEKSDLQRAAERNGASATLLDALAALPDDQEYVDLDDVASLVGLPVPAGGATPPTEDFPVDDPAGPSDGPDLTEGGSEGVGRG